MNLDQKQCTPCQGGIPPMVSQEAQKYLEQVPGWNLNKDATKLCQKYFFPDFVSAFNCAKIIADIAEKEAHHPDITFGWGYCFVEIYTHKIQGLHENDFILAKKIDEALTRGPRSSLLSTACFVP